MNVQARLVSRFSSGGYTPREVKQVENFFVDSAMDTDADTFTVAIGDPYHELTEVLNRDNEVRVTLYASDTGKIILDVHVGAGQAEVRHG